jgi:hypothetical protein
MELLLDQLPPVEGNKDVEVPMQIDCGPDTLTRGLPITVSGVEALDTHPVAVAVKVNVVVPADMAVITPDKLIWATELLLLTHVPPVVGDMVVLVPIHAVDGPVKAIVGLALIVTEVVGSDKH